ITKHFPDGQAMVQALLAGNDILETFADVPTAVSAIKAAVVSGKLPEELLNARVKRVLMAKSWVGLDRYKPVKIENLIDDLNSRESEFLNTEFAEKTISLLKNEASILPILDLQKRIAFVSIDNAST